MIKVTFEDGSNVECKDVLHLMHHLQSLHGYDWHIIQRSSWFAMIDGLRDVMTAITPEDDYTYSWGYSTFKEDFDRIQKWIEEHSK